MARQPNPIRQRIALEGGKEIDAQFRQLGRTIQEAFQRIAAAARGTDSANAKLAASTDLVTIKTGELARQGRQLGATWRETGRATADLADDLRIVVRRLAAAGTAIAGALAAVSAAVSVLARSGAQAVDAAAKTAEGLGLTVTEYGRLEFAAGQAGVSTEQFGAALNALNSRVAEAVKGQKKLTDNIGLHPERWAEAARANALGLRAIDKTAQGGDRATQALRKLGIALRDSQGHVRTGRALLLDIADAFKALPAGVEKAGLAAAIFGEDVGRRMLPFLNQGRAGIVAFEREADRLGVVFTDEQARIATAFVDAEDKLRRAVAGLRHHIGLLFAPALTRRAERLTEILVANRRAILAFAEAGLRRATALTEDLFAALQGRDRDVRSGWILTARDAVVALAKDLRGAWERIIRPVFEAILAGADRLAKGINEALGTDITGRQLLIGAAVAHLIGLFNALATGLTIVSGLLGAWPLLLAAAIAAFDPEIWRAAVQIVKDLAAALSGRDADVQNKWILEARDGIKAFAADVRTAVVDILLPLFRGLLETFDLVAAGINKIFGTDFTGRQVILAAIVLKLVGAFALLNNIVGTVASALFGLLAGGRIVAALVEFIAFVAKFGLLLAGWPALIAAAIALAVAAIIIYWDDVEAAATAAFDFVIAAAAAGWDGVAAIWNGLGDFFAGLLDGIAAAFDAVWDGIVARAEAAFNSLLALWRRLQSLIASTQASASSASAIAGGGAGVPVLAGGGGPLQGPGTATSDSILARLSRGEFVVQARAVAYYGADLLRALNTLRLPRGGGFNMGGLVAGLEHSLGSLAPRAALPAFAAGGPVAAQTAEGQPINLFLDGRRYPVTASRPVAKDLTREVLADQRSSAGRKPGWFGG